MADVGWIEFESNVAPLTETVTWLRCSARLERRIHKFRRILAATAPVVRTKAGAVVVRGLGSSGRPSSLNEKPAGTKPDCDLQLTVL